VAWLYFDAGLVGSREIALSALDQIESRVAKSKDGRGPALIGLAYERGEGRAHDVVRAAALYRAGMALGSRAAALGLVRVSSFVAVAPAELESARALLEQGRRAGDAECALYLAHLSSAPAANGGDATQRELLLQEACSRGLLAACEALERPERPIELRATAGAW
jgi:TPR repeat protein